MSSTSRRSYVPRQSVPRRTTRRATPRRRRARVAPPAPPGPDVPHGTWAASPRARARLEAVAERVLPPVLVGLRADARRTRLVRRRGPRARLRSHRSAEGAASRADDVRLRPERRAAVHVPRLRRPDVDPVRADAAAPPRRRSRRRGCPLLSTWRRRSQGHHPSRLERPGRPRDGAGRLHDHAAAGQARLRRSLHGARRQRHPRLRDPTAHGEGEGSRGPSRRSRSSGRSRRTRSSRSTSTRCTSVTARTGSRPRRRPTSGFRPSGSRSCNRRRSPGSSTAPEAYDPIDHPFDAKFRRDFALDRMVRYGYLDRARADRLQGRACCGIPLSLQRGPGAQIEAPGDAEYFVQYTRETLAKRYGPAAVFGGGLQVTTSLDLGYQAAAEQAIESHLPSPADPGASLVAIEPKTGQILAMAGGKDFSVSQLNLATFKGGAAARRARPSRRSRSRRRWSRGSTSTRAGTGRTRSRSTTRSATAPRDRGSPRTRRAAGAPTRSSRRPPIR